ncbi:MAG: cbb3-type cytochrome c oxidase subunit 3 [Hyphomicrobiales bacterium]|nr:cbb3-type cytochrome c oxidase subunit 3 [Hyphomicrobiales bacterium]
MTTYDVMRQFADSWGLLFLTLVFVGIFVWVFWPGSRGRFRDQADIPFKYEKFED